MRVKSRAGALQERGLLGNVWLEERGHGWLKAQSKSIATWIEYSFRGKKHSHAAIQTGTRGGLAKVSETSFGAPSQLIWKPYGSEGCRVIC